MIYIPHDLTEAVDIGNSTMGRLSHEGLEKDFQVLLFEVVEGKTIESYLFGTKNRVCEVVHRKVKFENYFL